MDEMLTLEQINTMTKQLEHNKEVIGLQEDIISLLKELKNDGLRSSFCIGDPPVADQYLGEKVSFKLNK